MHWLLTPFDKHSDDGFGAMGTAFLKSAETLMSAERDAIAHRELPTCFLLRHAAELFLKSALVVAHRALTGQQDYPSVLVKKNIKPITSIHGLGPLYSALINLLTEHRVALEARTRTAWLPMPVELDHAIAAIDAMDIKGVFFRYPTEHNSTKSANKPISQEEILAWDVEKMGYLKAFVVLDDNEAIVEAYHYKNELLTQELADLKIACQWLTCIHVGLRMELASGW